MYVYIGDRRQIIVPSLQLLLLKVSIIVTSVSQSNYMTAQPSPTVSAQSGPDDQLAWNEFKHPRLDGYTGSLSYEAHTL